MSTKSIAYLFLLAVLIVYPSNKCVAAGSQLVNFDKEWDYSDPEITELKFLELLTSIDFNDHPGYYTELQTQIARTLGLQHKFDEAHLLLDEIQKNLPPGYPVAEIRYNLEKGRIYNSSGHASQSIPFFLKAWELSRDAGADYHAVDAAHMLGIATPPSEQLKWSKKALELAETSMDSRTKSWLGALYNNIGWTYHDLGEYKQALIIFEKAQRWRQMNRQVREIQIADWAVARTHRSLGNVDLALAMQLNLEKEIAQSGDVEDGYVFEEIGECLLLKNQPEQAAPYFLKACTILSQDPWLQKNESKRLARLKKLGQ